MPKGSKERTTARREEIINACETLYQTMSFKDITIKEIGEITSFTRTSIYNYFQTKEEIFLALLEREYNLWVDDLHTLIETNDTLTTEELSDALAHSLAKRELMLKLVSINLFDMEANSRDERLVEFKVSYGNTLKAVIQCLIKFCPKMTEKERKEFIYAFFPFIYGIYPYAAVNDRQRMAIEKANIPFVHLSIYELAYTCTKNLLCGKGE